jgi:hypothetical protein
MKTAIEIIEIWGTILTILTAYQIVLGQMGCLNARSLHQQKSITDTGFA